MIQLRDSDIGRDPLTGLHDRAELMASLADARAAGRPFALLFLDLDRFKLINDTLGHAIGDELLQLVASRLREVPPAGAVVARLSGDEFAILAEGDAEQAKALGAAVREAFTEPFALGGFLRHVSLSVGVRPWDPVADAALGAAELLRDADAAMYEAKDGGRDRVAVFSAELRRRLVERLTHEHALYEALTAGELRVAYQPIVDLWTGRVTGVEALVRWPGGPAPDVFIPYAEEGGFVVEIDQFVLEAACRQLRAWDRQGRRLYLSVNVSPLNLGRGDLPARVRRVLDETGVDGRRLCLEITETSAVAATDALAEDLAGLHRLGAYLAVDDFGTGFSSLSRLKQLAIEVLKLDRSFVSGLASCPEDQAICAAIFSLAHALGLHVVAEGVEEPAQARELLALGATVAQGYLMCPPVPAEQVPGHVVPDAWLHDAEHLEPQPAPVRGRAHERLVVEMMGHVGVPIEEAA